MTREATAARRWVEQENAASLGGFEVRLLKDRHGYAFREARLHLAAEFLPSLWREIREFEPDYLFCPPVPESSLVGVHVDHLDVAQAVRSVAYMINVPHAFSPEYPRAESMPARSIRTPVILNTYDGYMAGGHGHDVAVNITMAADRAADLAWCHESQLQEWLPWVDRHNLAIAQDRESWRQQYRSVLERRKRALGIEGQGVFEVFNVTAWGVVPTLDQILRDFPTIDAEASRLERLSRRLDLWRSASGE